MSRGLSDLCFMINGNVVPNLQVVSVDNFLRFCGYKDVSCLEDAIKWQSEPENSRADF